MDNDAKITLGLLNMVHDNAAASQRSMADGLGIALGLANAYLKRCVKKGLIKVRQAPANRYMYYLTPKGFSEKSALTAEFLSQSLSLFRVARAEAGSIYSTCIERNWTRVALIGSGDLTEIFALSAPDERIELAVYCGDAEIGGELASLMRLKRLEDIVTMDAAIICDLKRPAEFFDAVAAHIPHERVLAPHFLGIPAHQEAIMDEDE